MDFEAGDHSSLGDSVDGGTLNSWAWEVGAGFTKLVKKVGPLGDQNYLNCNYIGIKEQTPAERGVGKRTPRREGKFARTNSQTTAGWTTKEINRSW